MLETSVSKGGIVVKWCECKRYAPCVFAGMHLEARMAGAKTERPCHRAKDGRRCGYCGKVDVKDV